MGFKAAIRSTPGLEQAYRPGLQAIRTADHDHISCGSTRTLTGSADLDGALAVLLPDDPRWDYAVGLKPRADREKVIWIEIHPASSHHVDEVLKKFTWLKGWLRTHALQLNAFPPEFVWIASGSVALRRGSPQIRKLAAQGLRFAGGHLHLT